MIYKQNSQSSQDHPRRCGENSSILTSSLSQSGSPPQVRGKPDSKPTYTANDGITPAGAGKTQSFSCPRASVQDHPRRCGENLLLILSAFRVLGSPPQVRGKQKGLLVIEDDGRITPAGAGKTQGRNIIASINRDHPRRCGENPQHRTSNREKAGSPPQVRGKH